MLEYLSNVLQHQNHFQINVNIFKSSDSYPTILLNRQSLIKEKTRFKCLQMEIKD